MSWSEGGYVYSGSVQPVRTLLNQPQQISLKGTLGEVSVPFTDARLEPDAAAEVVYRLYYETIHWVKASGISPVDGSAVQHSHERISISTFPHLRSFLAFLLFLEQFILQVI